MWVIAQELYEWSVTEGEAFWDSIWRFFQVIASTPYESSVKKENVFFEVEWFPKATFNYAENMLRYRNLEKDAIVFYGEDKVKYSYTFSELYDSVTALASYMRENGIRKGDVVSGYLPNLPETIIAMLATAAVGGIWCSCATDIGAQAAIDRIGQTKPSMLITTDGYFYKGKTFSMISNVKEIVEGIDSLKKVVLVHYAGIAEERTTVPKSDTWEEATKDIVKEFLFEQVDYNHPMVIMFSSGTTGKPKCMVQSGMGLLINQLKELGLHCDMKESDKLLYITSCSWMMWNWQAAALGLGTTLVLYDGNPSFPTTNAIWKIVEQEKVTIFGLSASYIHALMKEEFFPCKNVNLAYLTQIVQTGSALSPEGFEFVYRDIKQDIFFNSIAGGTDINGCFAIANKMQPVFSEELQAAGLGMKIACYDDNGNKLLEEQGELVCEKPTPSMPLYFWDDINNEKYKDSYFTVYDGIWRHGDYVIFHKDTTGITFYGRLVRISKE